ncbi:hypothetical protein ANN_04826 [Periplaneta americana]|uniref:Uncharacterized protein n=1 Tax=Periplaneta americana TaxID=6978 RepID=A0ABQ8TB28_PERAM|nr:hypothetical protein ANN_04826 [Periplaneta americana]
MGGMSNTPVGRCDYSASALAIYPGPVNELKATELQIAYQHDGALPQYAHIVVVITEDVQNVHLLLEYRPHIDVSLTCEHDPKLQEYCVCPQNMPQFDSEGIPNQAPETNKPMILNGPTSINREGSDQVSVEAKQLGHLYSTYPSIRKPSIQVPASRKTEVGRSAIMQEVNVLTID